MAFAVTLKYIPAYKKFMNKYYAAILALLAAFSLSAQPKVETPCVLLNKLVDDFPNNCTKYVGEYIKPTDDDGWGNQNDTKFETQVVLPGARETYFYNELFKQDNIYFARFYKGGDTTQCNMEFNRWRSRIEDCIYTFGTLATIESEDEVEKKIYFYPLDIVGDMAKKYHQLVMELKVFKGTKVKDNGAVIPDYSVEFRLMRDRTQ